MSSAGKSWQSLLFVLGLALLIGHELGAVGHQE
jgi:hypothetical protein